MYSFFAALNNTTGEKRERKNSTKNQQQSNNYGDLGVVSKYMGKTMKRKTNTPSAQQLHIGSALGQRLLHGYARLTVHIPIP